MDTEDGDDMPDAAEPSSVGPAAVTAATTTTLEEPTPVAAPEGISRTAPTDAATADMDAAAATAHATEATTTPTPLPNIEIGAEVAQPAAAAAALNVEETAHV